MSAAVDFIRGKTTIGELSNLPNRYSHHFYRDNYVQSLAALKNPEGPEAKKMQGEALASALTGGAM